MSDESAFYNTERSRCLTYLEFGSIDTQTCEKRIWDFRLHQEAYDFLMLARYAKDLVAFRKIIESLTGWSIDQQLDHYAAQVFTHDIYNSFSKLAALHVSAQSNGSASFLELGSTLMGCIDALEYVQKSGLAREANFSKLKLQEVVFHAVDISELLNSAALLTHPGYRIHTHLDWKKVSARYDVFFAKGVSMLYAIASAQELGLLLKFCRIGSFDYSLALGPAQEQYLGTGKNVLYLSAEECIDALKLGCPDHQLYIHKPTAEFESAKRRIRGLFWFASPKDLALVTREEDRLRHAFSTGIGSEKLRLLLNYRDMPYSTEGSFVPLDQYIGSLS